MIVCVWNSGAMCLSSSNVLNFELKNKKDRKTRKIYIYIQRKTALEIYIQSAKCQAGLSALRQSFLS